MLAKRLTRCIAFAHAFALGTCMGVARAQEPPSRVELAWTRGDGAASCLDEQELKRRVHERLGRDPFADHAALSIQGTVWRDTNAWRAELRIVGGDGGLLGSRKLDSTASDCAALSEAVILAVALTIDPDAASGPAPPSAAFPTEPATGQAASTAAVVPAPHAPPSSVAPPAAPALPRESELLSLEMVAHGGVAAGILPRIGPLVGIAGSYGPRALRLTLGLSWLPEQATDDGQFAFGLTFAGAGGCYGADIAEDVAARLCAEVQVGAMHAVVRDRERFVPLDTGDHLWVAGGAGPRLSFRFAPPLRLEVGALAVVPIVRKAFAIRGAPDTIFQSEAVGAIGYVGIGVGVP